MLIFCLLLLTISRSQACEEVCYPDVECFDNCYPFEDFPLPNTPERINTRFFLHTRNETAEIVPSAGAEEDRWSDFDPLRVATVFIIHGFSDTSNRPWIRRLRDELLENDDVNVVYVDWTRGALPDPERPTEPVGASNARVVGRLTRNLIRDMLELGMEEDAVHCIGYSVGGQACGFLGKEFQDTQIGRISGLDPAGGYAFNGCPEPSLCRLTSDDAAFVDVTHTNGFGTLATSGISLDCGDVDVWVNRGDVQPGCGNDVTGFCSHERSHRVFQETVNSDCLFTSRMCESFEDMRNGTCKDHCEDDDCQYLGFKSITSSNRGRYLVWTNEESPFCID